MKRESEESVQFETVIRPDGSIVLPPDVRKQEGAWLGRRVHVRLTTVELARELKARNVEESEVLSIAGLQLESRARVVRFLLTEGALPEPKRRGKGRA